MDRHDTADLCIFMCVLGEDEARNLAVPKKPFITNQRVIQAESQTCPFLR